MSDVVKSIRRSGTSYIDFQAKFPDDRACIDHLIDLKLHGQKSCSNCGKLLEFKKNRNRFQYISRCCCFRTVSPLVGTMFFRSWLPLSIWFRAILYFTNAAIGVGPDFLSRQLGISRSAAKRMCSRIRHHLTSIDESIHLGTNGNCIYVSETTMKAISRVGRKNGVRFRVMTATDGGEFLIVPIATGYFGKSRKLLMDRLLPGVPIVFQSESLRDKVFNLRGVNRFRGHEIRVTDDPYQDEFNALCACEIALKRFVLGGHHRVSEAHFLDYIGHFAFLYRRRHRGGDAFWEAISHFPALPSVS